MLEKIFKDLYNDLSLFGKEEIDKLNNSIYEKNGKYFLKSNSKNEEEKQICSEKKLAPEEVVRQLFLNRLVTKYKYPKELIETETTVSFGREKKRADIIVYKDDKITPFIVVEVKAPNANNDIEQLKSYLNAKGAQVGVAINGQVDEILYRPYPKDFSTLPDIPEYKETPQDVFNKKYKYKDLKEPLQLKKVIQQLENIVLANSGFDSFDELFKIFYAKLYDEILGREDEDYILEFRSRNDENTTKNVINKLFDKAKDEWKDIFDDSDKIKLKADSVKDIVSDL